MSTRLINDIDFVCKGDVWYCIVNTYCIECRMREIMVGHIFVYFTFDSYRRIGCKPP